MRCNEQEILLSKIYINNILIKSVKRQGIALYFILEDNSIIWNKDIVKKEYVNIKCTQCPNENNLLWHSRLLNYPYLCQSCSIKNADYSKTIRKNSFNIGDIIEGLTVDNIIIKNSKPYYECKCICGTYKIFTSSQLTSKQVVSCGCFHHRTGKHNPCFRGYEEIHQSFWRRVENREKEGLEVTIDIKYAWELFIKQNRQCALTGLDIYFAKNTNENGTASLDRIDSLKGYIEGNVQWVHKDVNRMKNNFSINRYIEICKLVANKHQDYTNRLGD